MQTLSSRIVIVTCLLILPVPELSASRTLTAGQPLNRNEVLQATRTNTLIKLRHLARDERGNLIVESDHFRIVYDKTPELMEKVARAAELARLETNRRWFGDTAYEWDGKCSIYLYANHALYAKKTKQKGALAHAQAWMQGKYVHQRSVHLPCDAAQLFEDVLPHEIAHSVHAIRFNGSLPRWADEGMATVAESAASVKEFRKRLLAFREKNALFALEVLMQTTEPEHTNCQEYYSQSMSLVEFFVAERGRKTFTSFLMDSIQTSYDAALKKHYHIESFAELERRWTAFAFPPRRLQELPQAVAMLHE